MLRNICISLFKRPVKPPGKSRCKTTSSDGRNVRKAWRNMNQKERDTFNAAFDQLVQTGAIETLVRIHSSPARMHGYQYPNLQRFLPWHRAFLLDMERRLKEVDECAILPYWDASRTQAFPPGLTRPFNVTRSIGASNPLPSRGQESDMLSNPRNTSYADFSTALERWHDRVHTYVGGTMGSIPAAPRDPVFWMHHANVDRIWQRWMNAGGRDDLAGLARDPRDFMVSSFGPVESLTAIIRQGESSTIYT